MKPKPHCISWWQFALGAGFVLVLTVFLYNLYKNSGYDDPYITYRYARNIATGQGFVYNPGERVLSTTTPLFTLLLAGLFPLWSDLPHLANLIGAASLAIGGLLLWDLARGWGTPRAGWVMLLLYPLFPVVTSTIGSETPLYLTLGIGTFAAYSHRRYTLAGLLAALAILARPDAVLIAGILGADFIIRRLLSARSAQSVEGQPPQPRFPWQALVVFGLILGSWAVFSQLYFGELLPVTLFTKQAQGSLAISTTFVAGLFSKIIAVYWGNPLYSVMALLAIVGMVSGIVKQSRWWLFLAWPVIYFVSYAVLGVSSYFWYYAPLAMGFIVLVGLGVDGLSVLAARLFSAQSLANKEQLANRLVVAFLLVLVPWQVVTVYRASQYIDPRLLAYTTAGKWLAKNTTPDEHVGLLEVGIIGYYSERPVVDFAGLIQPDVAHQMAHASTYEDTAIWAVTHFKPEIVLVHQGGFPRLEATILEPDCQNIETIPGKNFGYQSNLLIYRCP